MIKLAIVPNEDLPSSFALTRPIATRNGAVELSQKPFKFHTNLHFHTATHKRNRNLRVAAR